MGVFCFLLRKSVVSHSRVVGERVWRLPRRCCYRHHSRTGMSMSVRRYRTLYRGICTWSRSTGKSVSAPNPALVCSGQGPW